MHCNAWGWKRLSMELDTIWILKTLSFSHTSPCTHSYAREQGQVFWYYWSLTHKPPGDHDVDCKFISPSFVLYFVFSSFFSFFLGHKSWKLWRHLCFWNRHNSVWRKNRDSNRFTKNISEENNEFIFSIKDVRNEHCIILPSLCNRWVSKVKMLNFRKKSLFIFHRGKCPR